MSTTPHRARISITTGESGQLVRSPAVTIAKPGDPIPAVSLRSTANRMVHLQAEAEASNLVLFFYPGDLEGLRYPEMSGCTPEACSFRDNVSELRALKTEVFGVNLHSTARQKSFVQREHLNFELLSDEAQALTKALGVPCWRTEFGETFVARTTVIIKQGGAIARVIDDVHPAGHVDVVIEAIKAL